jgi:hypothetical protein
MSSRIAAAVDRPPGTEDILYGRIDNAVAGRRLKAGLEVHMAYSRQWVVDTLRRNGYLQEADEALRVLPDEVDVKQLQEFGDRHGISRDELISRMGGSP